MLVQLHRRHVRKIILLFLSLFLFSCGGGGGGGGSTTSVYTLTGTISTASGIVTDSDINDPSVTPVSNDSIVNAQSIPNPVIVGGFVTLAGTRLSGSNYENAGDINDYFGITLTGGQVITLSFSSPADLDLWLYDSSGTVLAWSLGVNTKVETITVPNTVTQPTTLYMRVQAYDGSSTYNLAVSQAGISIAGSSATQEAEYIPGELIVKFRESKTLAAAGRNTLSSRAQSVGMQGLAGGPGQRMLMSIRQDQGLKQASTRLDLPEVPVAANQKLQMKLNTALARKALKRHADVEDVQLNYVYRAHAVPNDTYYSRQWHYPLINLPQAWDITTGSSSAIVAVIDSGIVPSHEDLAGRLVQGYDFIRDTTNAGDNNGIDADPTDPDNSSGYHGTHVAGTIAAVGNNSTGVTGVGWNLRVMPLRVLGSLGGTSYDLAQAIRYAAGLSNDSNTVPAQRADVINMSLGGLPSTDTTVSSAITAARNAGVIVVASAGNNASSELTYPASFDGVISVSAVDTNKSLAPYSSFGSKVDIAAPGGNMAVDLNGDGYPDGVLSTLGPNSDYGYYQGTSMAAPHVSGVIALMQAIYKSIRPGQYITPGDFDLLLASGTITEDIGIPGRDDSYGYGLVNAYKAVVQAQSLANGNPIPQVPILSISPASFNFGTAATTGTLVLKNVGNGNLVISSVTENSSGWLSLTRQSVDANGGETWLLTVDRTGLADNIYTATIMAATNDRNVSIPVIMQVASNLANGNASTQYVYLKNATTGVVVQQLSVQPVSGDYSYTFSNVSAGSYYIYASSNLNYDNNICDAGESCGAYPILTFPTLTPIQVNGDLSGLNFSTAYTSSAVSLSSMTTTPASSVRP